MEDSLEDEAIGPLQDLVLGDLFLSTPEKEPIEIPSR
jgi:hypothetical protein